MRPWMWAIHDQLLRQSSNRCGIVEMDLLGMLCWDLWSLRRLSIFPFFFCTTTTFANHFGKCTSLIMPVFRSLSTSSCIIWFLSGANFLLFWCMGLKEGSMPNLWVIIFLLIPIISSGFQANVLLWDLRNFIRSSSICAGSEDPINILVPGSSGSKGTSFTSCSLSSRTSSTLRFDCYASL